MKISPSPQHGILAVQRRVYPGMPTREHFTNYNRCLDHYKVDYAADASLPDVRYVPDHLLETSIRSLIHELDNIKRAIIATRDTAIKLRRSYGHTDIVSRGNNGELMTPAEVFQPQELELMCPPSDEYWSSPSGILGLRLRALHDKEEALAVWYQNRFLAVNELFVRWVFASIMSRIAAVEIRQLIYQHMINADAAERYGQADYFNVIGLGPLTEDEPEREWLFYVASQGWVSWACCQRTMMGARAWDEYMAYSDWIDRHASRGT
jgi:hypothetical protein